MVGEIFLYIFYLVEPITINRKEEQKDIVNQVDLFSLL